MVESHRDVFCGEVTKAAFLGINIDDQWNALKAMGGHFSVEKDDFTFHFREDMETFLSHCVDQCGLKVNAMVNN